MKTIIFLLSLLFSINSQAQNINKDQNTQPNYLNKASDYAKDTMNFIADGFGKSRQRRSESQFLFMLNYSPIDLILPSKYGANVGWIKNADTTYELDYLRGSVTFIIDDLGSMYEERVSLTKRSFMGNSSLNINYGLSFFNFDVNLSDELMGSISPIYENSAREIQIQTLGFHVGISNRWTFQKNITFSVDWVSWAQPIFKLYRYEKYLENSNNEDDKDDVKKAIDIVTYFPRLTFLKLQLGISF